MKNSIVNKEHKDRLFREGSRHPAGAAMVKVFLPDVQDRKKGRLFFKRSVPVLFFCIDHQDPARQPRLFVQTPEQTPELRSRTIGRNDHVTHVYTPASETPSVSSPPPVPLSEGAA